MDARQPAIVDIIVRGALPPYPVTARFRGTLAESLLAGDAALAPWPDWIGQLDRSQGAPGATLLEQVGQALAAALFTGAVGELWQRVQQALAQGRITGIRLRLALEPAAVAALPWELLADPHRGMPLAVTPGITLVRIAMAQPGGNLPRPLRSRLPLRVLAVVPDDPTGQLDSVSELAALEAMAARFGPEIVRLSPVGGRLDSDSLRLALQAHEPDLLIITTHGEHNRLLFWADDEPHWLVAGSLRALLEECPSVRLVLLNACLAGRNHSDDAAASVGTALLQAGIPAVIAMQFDLEPFIARKVTESLLAELLAGRRPGSVDEALRATRTALFAAHPHELAFGVPVLWLNSEQGQIVALSAEQVALVRSRAGAGGTLLTLEGPQRERRELLAWLAAWEMPDVRTISAEFQPIRTRIGAIRHNLAGLCAQMAALETQLVTSASVEQYQEKLQQARSERATAERLLELLQTQSRGVQP